MVTPTTIQYELYDYYDKPHGVLPALQQRITAFLNNNQCYSS
jgi:hypothetical protein